MKIPHGNLQLRRIALMLLMLGMLASCGGRSVSEKKLKIDEPIEPPKRELALLSEADRTAIRERTRSRSYTAVLASLRKKIRVGMTAKELRTSLGSPRDWKNRMNTPFQGKVSEWYYTRSAVLVNPPEDVPKRVNVNVIVVIRNGRVTTWYEM